MLAVAWPFGCPARFTDTGGAQTRCAQAMCAFSPVSAALLGHATRPGDPTKVSRRQLKCEEKKERFFARKFEI
jgi:hypothetical protein